MARAIRVFHDPATGEVYTNRGNQDDVSLPDAMHPREVLRYVQEDGIDGYPVPSWPFPDAPDKYLKWNEPDNRVEEMTGTEKLARDGRDAISEGAGKDARAASLAAHPEIKAIAKGLRWTPEQTVSNIRAEM